MSSAFGGAHVEIDITEAEDKAMPQLNAGNAWQYDWAQFMVWRRWLLVTALLTSCIILAISAVHLKTSYEKLMDVLQRCDDGSDPTIYSPSDGKFVARDAVLDDLLQPLDIAGKTSRFVCAPPANGVTGYSFGQEMNCSTEVNQPDVLPDSGNMFGECKWFPFAPWMKDLPTPMHQTLSNSTVSQAFGFGNMNFMSKASGAGCGAGNKQYAQAQTCICSTNLEVFDSFSFLNFAAANLGDALNDDDPAKLRSILRFADPMYCQAPSFAHSNVCGDRGACTTQTPTGVNLHKKRCAVTLSNGIRQEGIVSKFAGEFEACYFSKDAKLYNAKEYADRFPKAEERSCCQPAEYLFKRALWNTSSAALEYFKLALNLIVVAMNVLCAAVAIAYWNNWKVSRTAVFIAWVFPFVLKFTENSIPAFEAQRVDPVVVASLALDYGLLQLGYPSFDSLKQISTILISDAVRQGLVGPGKAGKLVKGDGLNCGESTRYLEMFADTFNTTELSRIEEHTWNNYPTLGDYFRQEQELGDFASEVGFGPRGRCAGMAFAADYVCENPTEFGFAYNATPPECGICGDGSFCRYDSETNTASGCCGSCLGKIQTAVGISSWIPTEMLATQNWNTYAKCVEGGSVTYESKECNRYQAYVPMELNLPRLFSCDPLGTFKYIQSVSDSAPFDSVTKIPALGETCGALGTPESQACFSAYSVLPLSVDFLVPYSMDQASVVLKWVYAELVDKATLAINIGVRLRAAGAAAAGMLPITIAILPGIAKGAMQAKLIVPQASLISYVLVVVPILQIPMLGAVMCVLIQAGGTWKVCGSVYFFMCAQVLPIYAASRATGPHSCPRAFKIAYKGGKIAQLKIICLLCAVGLAISALFDSGLTSAIDLKSLLGSGISMKALKVLSILLNFIKGKTFTTVMSADLLLQLLITLEGFKLLMPERAMECREKLTAGLLLSLSPDDAAHMLAKYDADGDGEFDEEEITEMMKEVGGDKVRRLQQFEDECVSVRQKRKAKHDAKAGQKPDAPPLTELQGVWLAEGQRPEGGEFEQNVTASKSLTSNLEMAAVGRSASHPRHPVHQPQPLRSPMSAAEAMAAAPLSAAQLNEGVRLQSDSHSTDTHSTDTHSHTQVEPPVSGAHRTYIEKDDAFLLSRSQHQLAELKRGRSGQSRPTDHGSANTTLLPMEPPPPQRNDIVTNITLLPMDRASANIALLEQQIRQRKHQLTPDAHRTLTQEAADDCLEPSATSCGPRSVQWQGSARQSSC
jgi:hypothetical protein